MAPIGHRTLGGTYWRNAHFLFPFWVMPPVARIEENVMVRGWIPLDDEHCMFVGIAAQGLYCATTATARRCPARR